MIVAALLVVPSALGQHQATVPCDTGGPPSGITVTPTTVNGTAAYQITFAQSESVNDNSYSSKSPTPFWNGKQHKFQDLVGSDKAEFLITNGGATLFDFTLDYISQDKTNTVSGYSSLGPFGGDGSFKTGTQSAILDWSTSEADNLNTFCSGGNCTVSGVNLLTDSPPPANENDESAGAAAPFQAWQYQDIYTVTIAASALPANFSASNVSIPLVHNSPAKSGTTPCPLPSSFTVVKGQRVGNTGDYVTTTLPAMVGQVVQYQLLVTNTGGTTLTNVTPTDTGCDPGTLSPGSVASLTAGSNTTFLCSHTVTAADQAAGSYTNPGTNQVCSVAATPPAGGQLTQPCGPVTVVVPSISLAYADSYAPRADALPTPWVGGVTKFVGCGSTPTGTTGTPGSASDPCQTFHDVGGVVKDQYDAGAIRIVNNSTSSLTVTNSSVVEGPCTYTPWPGLNVTLAPGESLILTQTGLPGSPTPENATCPGPAEVGPGFNFDTSEAGGNGHCTDSGYTPVITLTLNGVPTTITDTARILNHQGIDVGACGPNGVDQIEFTQWTPVP